MCFSLPQWAKRPSQIGWGNVGRNYVKKRTEQPLPWRWSQPHNKHRHQLGNRFNFSQLVLPSFLISTHIHQWWSALDVSRATAIHLPLITLSGAERDAVRTNNRAWPVCLPVCGEIIYFNLSCVSRYRCNSCNPTQMKLGGEPLAKPRCQGEGLGSRVLSCPSSAVPWVPGAGRTPHQPWFIPPNKPARSHFSLTDLLQNNGPCQT